MEETRGSLSNECPGRGRRQTSSFSRLGAALPPAPAPGSAAPVAREEWRWGRGQPGAPIRGLGGEKRTPGRRRGRLRAQAAAGRAPTALGAGRWALRAGRAAPATAPGPPAVCVLRVRGSGRRLAPLGHREGAIRERTKARGHTCAPGRGAWGAGRGRRGEGPWRRGGTPVRRPWGSRGGLGGGLPARWRWRREGGRWGRRTPPCGQPALTCRAGEGAAARGVPSRHPRRPRVRGALLAPLPSPTPPAPLTHAGELGGCAVLRNSV